MMRCQNCQAEVGADFSFCERCGSPLKPGVTPPYAPSAAMPPRKKENTTLLIVLVIVLVIVITVAPSILLYYMVLGFGGNEEQTPIFNVVEESAVYGGVKITFNTPTSPLDWGDAILQLSEGDDFVTWDEFTTSDLYGPGYKTWAPSEGKIFGGMFVTLAITDMTGNGEVNYPDFIVLTTSTTGFPSGHTYTLVAIYEPTGGLMMSHDYST